MKRKIIRGGLVATMVSREQVYHKGLVAIDGNELVYVGPAAEAPAELTEPGWADQVIDATGHAILPGYVNTHHHMAMTLLRGYADDLPLEAWLHEKIFPAEAKLTPTDIYWGTKLAAIEMVKSGTTTALDMYWDVNECAQATLEVGFRAMYGRGILGDGPGADERLAEAEQNYRDWHMHQGGLVTVCFAPHSTYLTPPETLAKVKALAEKYDAAIHIHNSETTTEVATVVSTYGKTPTQHIYDLGLFEHPVIHAHCVHLTVEDIALHAQAQGGGIAHNPYSNLKLGSGIAPLTRLRAAGARVALGTDGASSTNDLTMQEEIRLAALLAKNSGGPAAIDGYAVIEMATRIGAEVLGLDHLIGTLTPGKRADLQLIDLRRPHLTPEHDLFSNLAYAGRGDDVTMVLVDGRVVVEGGQVVTVDEAEARAQVAERALRVVGTAQA